MIDPIKYLRAGDTVGPNFLHSKKKKETKGKKRVSKQKLLKGCHQSQNVIVLAILEHIEFKNVSCRPTMVTDNTFQCSMARLLSNPFRWSCIYDEHFPENS